MSRVDRTNSVHHVYRCYDDEGRLIYVGSTANLFGRLAQHRTSSWWSSQAIQVTAKVYPNGIAARAVERRAIREEQPRWNKVGRWPSRHGWTRSQWDDWLTMLLASGAFTTELKRFVELYRRRWAESPAKEQMARVVVVEADAARRKSEADARYAEQRLRWAAIEREEEAHLKAWRDERASRGIPVDCLCTDEEYASRRFDEDCAATHHLLDTAVL